MDPRSTAYISPLLGKIVLLLHRIERAELNFLPSPLRSLIAGWIGSYQNRILTALIALLGLAGLVRAIKRLWSRRRAKRKLVA
jgi:hypothetical protein